MSAPHKEFNVISSRRRFSAVCMPRVSALLLGGLLLSGQVLADVEVSAMSANPYDNLAVTHAEGGNHYSLRSSGLSIDDLKKMQVALQNLQRSHDEQARQLTEFKRNNGSGSGSNANEMADLKRTVKEQQSEMGTLRKQLEELKRGGSSSSSAGELSSLKREVSDQSRELQNLKRSVDDLSRKIK